MSPMDHMGRHRQILPDLLKGDSFHQITASFLLPACLRREGSFHRGFQTDHRTVLSFLLTIASFHLLNRKKEGSSLHITQLMKLTCHLINQLTSSLHTIPVERDRSLHTTLLDITKEDNFLLLLLVDFKEDTSHQCIMDLPRFTRDRPTI